MALYTSNSEFDLETRVQLTNEMPTTRDYEYLHHSLRNDTWKWLIGTEDVTYDLPVGGSESHNLEAPVKIVNGKQAENYGPNKQQVWDPTTESYVEKTPTFYKMEINGVLAAEHDLFLHEIYRYLSCLYPDHPDWLNLLTRNEILDAFNNAAAMVDYKPNNEFFRLVAETIQSDDPDVEEFKLNLRNLTNNATPRQEASKETGYYQGKKTYEQPSRGIPLNSTDVRDCYSTAGYYRPWWNILQPWYVSNDDPKEQDRFDGLNEGLLLANLSFRVFLWWTLFFGIAMFCFNFLRVFADNNICRSVVCVLHF